MTKLKPFGQYQDMRDAFFEELFQIAKQDKTVILLVADQGTQTLQKFKMQLPNQFFNIGITEQNMVGIAAGLALSGKKVFIHAIATFATLRCYEQIKVDLSIMNLPVTIAAIGAGYAYGADGPTHHSNQDIAIMRAIPGIRILNATDCINLSVFPHICYHKPQLSYIRFDKGNFAQIYKSNEDFTKGIAQVRQGKDACIVSTGTSIHKSIEIADVLKKVGLDIAVIDIYQPKPLNEKLLKKLLTSFTRIVTLEEQILYGGLGSIISDFIADQNLNSRLKRFGLPDSHNFNYGSREFMLNKVGLGSRNISKQILKFLQS